MAADGRSKTVTHVVRRILVEFGPPIMLAVAWTGWKFAQSTGTAFEAVTNFSAAFVLASYIWLQLLRIIHQESQREFQLEQKAMLSGIGSTLTGVDTSLTALSADFRALAITHPELRPEIMRLANTTTAASAQIAAASSAIDQIRRTRVMPLGMAWFDLPPRTIAPHPAHMTEFLNTPLPLRNTNATIGGGTSGASDTPASDARPRNARNTDAT
jgi:hypothetical protein